MCTTNFFTVMPGGASFETSDLSLRQGDQNGAFGKAHQHAACQAAAQKVPSYVIRSDTGNERYGFGPDAWRIPSTCLYQITRLGHASAWDYASTSWVPVKADQAYTEYNESQTAKA